MKILDLHGTRHADAQARVEEFILLNETPLRIITGKSTQMKELVVEILEKHRMYYFPEYQTNQGAYIIQDKTKI